jgi:hypothetical protein
MGSKLHAHGKSLTSFRQKTLTPGDIIDGSTRASESSLKAGLTDSAQDCAFVIILWPAMANHSLNQPLGQLFSPGYFGSIPGMELAPN